MQSSSSNSLSRLWHKGNTRLTRMRRELKRRPLVELAKLAPPKTNFLKKETQRIQARALQKRTLWAQQMVKIRVRQLPQKIETFPNFSFTRNWIKMRRKIYEKLKQITTNGAASPKSSASNRYLRWVKRPKNHQKLNCSNLTFTTWISSSAKSWCSQMRKWARFSPSSTSFSQGCSTSNSNQKLDSKFSETYLNDIRFIGLRFRFWFSLSAKTSK